VVGGADVVVERIVGVGERRAIADVVLVERAGGKGKLIIYIGTCIRD
jgi:hypothetical protein